MKKYLILFLTTIILTNCTSRKIANPNIQPSNQPYFLFLSDIHLALDINYTTYGQDAGTDVWSAFKIKIDSILSSTNPPKFILYTGDLPEHGGIYDTTLRNKNISSVLTDLQQMSAIKNLPVFYLPGNNDGLGGDYCFFTDQTGRTPFSLLKGYSPYPFNQFNVAQTPGSNKSYMISGANLSSGYYSAMVMGGLRIICLNSTIWSNSLCNECAQNCGDQQTQGDKQMQWLKQQLADAAFAGDKVYFAMHVPPGEDAYASRKDPSNPIMMWATADWQNQFLKSVNQYQQSIAGIFYGHTHMDEFRILYGDPLSNNVSQVAISCPGISARSDNNPGFKLVTIDAASKAPTDFTTYYSTVAPIVWQQPYTFSTLTGAKQGATIFQTLKQMSPAARKKLMDYTYTVRHNQSYFDTLGMSIRYIGQTTAK